MANIRGTFFFSQTQMKLSSNPHKDGRITRCKLDSGRIVEYTEMIRYENSDGSDLDSNLLPFLERFPDGVILGNGVYIEE